MIRAVTQPFSMRARQRQFLLIGVRMLIVLGGIGVVVYLMVLNQDQANRLPILSAPIVQKPNRTN